MLYTLPILAWVWADSQVSQGPNCCNSRYQLLQKTDILLQLLHIGISKMIMNAEMNCVVCYRKCIEHFTQNSVVLQWNFILVNLYLLRQVELKSITFLSRSIALPLDWSPPSYFLVNQKQCPFMRLEPSLYFKQDLLLSRFRFRRRWGENLTRHCFYLGRLIKHLHVNETNQNIRWYPEKETHLKVPRWAWARELKVQYFTNMRVSIKMQKMRLIGFVYRKRRKLENFPWVTVSCVEFYSMLSTTPWKYDYRGGSYSAFP